MVIIKDATMIDKKCSLFILMLLCLSACFCTNKLSPTNNFIIQAPFDVALITKLQKKVGSVIADIIKEEAHVEWDDNIPFFFFKKRAAITVYYVNDIVDNGEAYMLSVVEDMKNASTPHNVSVTTKVDFFGEPKPDKLALIDLVVVMDDSNKGLSVLNDEMKNAMHKANSKYKAEHHGKLYDASKSERFPYLPHLSIGHLRANHIKDVMQDKAESDKVIERIKERIMNVVSQALAEMTVADKNASFDRLSVYDTKKRVYIKEVILQ